MSTPVRIAFLNSVLRSLEENGYTVDDLRAHQAALGLEESAEQNQVSIGLTFDIFSRATVEDSKDDLDEHLNQVASALVALGHSFDDDQE